MNKDFFKTSRGGFFVSKVAGFAGARKANSGKQISVATQARSAIYHDSNLRNGSLTSAMANPYHAPKEPPAELPPKSSLIFWRWIVILLLIIIALNYARLLPTWNKSDAMHQIGFPFVVYESGGVGYSERFYQRQIIPNLSFAFVVVFIGAYLLRGLEEAFRKRRP